jgi:lysophospholipase L1-like esterase
MLGGGGGWGGRFTPACRGLVFVAVLVGMLGLLPGTASAHPIRGAYVALGDSYSSGVGTGRYDLAAACGRGSLAYPYLWRRANRPSGFEFRACAGAVIGDARRQAAASTMLPRARLVTVTVGGNDANFGGVVSVCANPAATDDQCYAEVDKGEHIATSVAFHDDLVALLSLIRKRAPGADIVMLGYPRLFEETQACAGVAPSRSRRARINTGAQVLRSAIEKATGDYRKTSANPRLVQFVDVDRYFADHRICARQPWIDGVVPSAQGESFHPNTAGHARGYLPALTATTVRLGLAAA